MKIDPHMMCDINFLIETTKTLVGFGYRRPGMDSEVNAANYIMNMFKSFGADSIQYEQFDIDGFDPIKTEIQIKSAYETDSPIVISAGSVWYTQSGEPEAQVISVNYGLNEHDWNDVDGKIVFCKSNVLGTVSVMHDIEDLYWKAQEKGAKGIIFATDFPFDMKTRYVEIAAQNNACKIPAAIVSNDDRVFLEDLIERKLIETIKLVSINKKFPASTGTIEAIFEGTEDRLYLLSHYDSTGVGAMDNAATNAIWLATAKYIGKLGKNRPTVIFLGISGHENYFGARGYVKAHESEMSKALFCLNFDAISSPGFVKSDLGYISTAHDEIRIANFTPVKEVCDVIFGAVEKYDLLPFITVPINELTMRFANGDSEGCFFNYGIPVFCSAAHNLFYHTDYDTLERLDFNRLMVSYNAYLEIILSILEMDPKTIKLGHCMNEEELMNTYLRKEIHDVPIGAEGKGIMFGMAPLNPRIHEDVMFYYSSFSNDKIILGYEWDFGDGNKSKDFFAKHSYSKPGMYEVKFSMTNIAGERVTAKRKLWILG